MPNPYILFGDKSEHQEAPGREPNEEYIYKIYPVDLHRIENELTPMSPSQLKLFFLDIGMTKRDKELELKVLQNQFKEPSSLQEQLLELQTRLHKAVDEYDNLEELKHSLEKLFGISNWWHFAKKLAKEEILDVDVFNTLMDWFAGYEESKKSVIKPSALGRMLGLYSIEGNMKLTVVSAENAIQYAQTQKFFHQSPARLIDTLALEVIVPGPRRVDINAFVYPMDGDHTKVRCLIPSATLIGNALNQRLITPFHTRGQLYFEDFLVAIYLRARLVQQYVPDGEYNLTKAHESELGFLANQHDYVHCILCYKNYPKAFAILLNTCAKLALKGNSSSRLSALNAQELFGFSDICRGLFGATNSIYMYQKNSPALEEELSKIKENYKQLFSEIYQIKTGTSNNSTLFTVEYEEKYHEVYTNNLLSVTIKIHDTRDKEIFFMHEIPFRFCNNTDFFVAKIDSYLNLVLLQDKKQQQQIAQNKKESNQVTDSSTARVSLFSASPSHTKSASDLGPKV